MRHASRRALRRSLACLVPLASLVAAPDLHAQGAAPPDGRVARNAVTVLFPILLWNRYSGEYARAIGGGRTLGMSATWLPRGVAVLGRTGAYTLGKEGAALADLKLHQYAGGAAFRGASIVLHVGGLAHRDVEHHRTGPGEPEALRWRVKPTLGMSAEYATSSGMLGDDVVVVGFGLKPVFGTGDGARIPMFNLSWGGLF